MSYEIYQRKVPRKQSQEENERVPFRLFKMPCCGFQLCWVNPRLPTYCPECGELVFHNLQHEQNVLLKDDNAWLKVHVGGEV